MATDYHTAELTVMFDGQFFCPDRLFGGEGMDLHNVIRNFLVLEIILTDHDKAWGHMLFLSKLQRTISGMSITMENWDMS
ncbi:hypothetical protein [Selenomonas sp. KH1T6]|uniref:hypothetical protein n=1 Tax=Selenomonas sp. KH1T6 TaxID=3158784 RepID=UPI0009438D4F